jgi:hypothetical protein
MSESNETPVITTEESQIDPRTERLDKLQASIDEIRTVIASTPPATASNPSAEWERIVDQQNKKIRELEEVLAAGKYIPTPSIDRDIKPKTFDQTRAQVGEMRWFKMSEAERLQAMNQDPNQDRGLLLKLWGKGADPRFSQDLFKTNPKKYRETREAARALDVFGR